MTIAEHLNPTQRAQLQNLLEEYEEVFRNQLGRTSMAEHRIITENASPIRLPPYRIPHAHRNAVRVELDEMLKDGIIEPS